MIKLHAFVVVSCVLSMSLTTVSYADFSPNKNDSIPSEVFQSLWPTPSQQLDEREKKLPRVDIEEEKKDEGRPSEPDNVKIQFRSFVLKGSSILSKEEVQKIISPFLGESMTFPQLQRLADILTKLYVRKGYQTSYCYVPSQKAEGGRVVFQCVETKIGRLVVKNAEEYNEKMFMRFIRPLRDKPLNITDLNERLKTLSLSPTFIANVSIRRTDKPDVVDVVVELKEKMVNLIEAYGDNMGSRLTGRERIGAVYNLVNPTGYGDLLSLNARTSADTSLNHFISATYKRLVNTHGGVLTMSAVFNDYEVDEKYVPANSDGTKTDTRGNNNLFSINYRHPLMIDSRTVITGSISYEFRDVSTQTLVGWKTLVADKEDKTHVFSVGVDMEMVDEFNGWNAISLSLQHGVEGFFNGMRDRDTHWQPTATDPVFRGTIREDVKPDFTLITANYYRRQALSLSDYKLENISTVYGQLTRDRVPSAYSFDDGDYGFHIGTEFRFPLKGDVLKLSLGAQHERYINTPKSLKVSGIMSQSTSAATFGCLGVVPRVNLEYAVQYTMGLRGVNYSWVENKNYDIVTFSLTKRF